MYYPLDSFNLLIYRWFSKLQVLNMIPASSGEYLLPFPVNIAEFCSLEAVSQFQDLTSIPSIPRFTGNGDKYGQEMQMRSQNWKSAAAYAGSRTQNKNFTSQHSINWATQIAWCQRSILNLYQMLELFLVFKIYASGEMWLSPKTSDAAHNFIISSMNPEHGILDNSNIGG